MNAMDHRAEVQARILEILPATSAALIRVLGLSDPTVHKHLKRMHADGLIHVGGWEAGERPGVIGRIWHAGVGEDAPRPGLSKKAVAARIYRANKTEKKANPANGKEWVLSQLNKNPIPITEIRQGNRTQQALSNLINRLAADGAISLSKGHAETGHFVRMVRKGKPQTDDELESQEIARDRVSSLINRNRKASGSKGEMLSMIWATAGFRRAA